MVNIPGLVFFDESSKMMSEQNIRNQSNRKAYVVLGMAIKNLSIMKKDLSFDLNDVNIARKYWINQTKTKEDFHFDTIGEIFGQGYGPKYCINEVTNLSIDKFATKNKNTSKSENSLHEQTKRKIYALLDCCIDHMFASFPLFKSNISPHITKLQGHFVLYEKDDQTEIKLCRNGILNAHLCLNAETRLKHTECDSSYTIICVPPQPKACDKNGEYNLAEFEFNTNDDEAYVLPLRPGTILIYSGYLLTHRQQIRKRNEQYKPFINIVSYSSQKLFRHLMQSFRREVKENSPAI